VCSSDLKIHVLAINETDGNYLRRLFEKDEFQFVQQSFQTLDYNTIPGQNFIVLNELKEIPAPLAAALKSFSDAGGSLLIIPASETDLDSYNTFLLSMQMGAFSQKTDRKSVV